MKYNPDDFKLLLDMHTVITILEGALHLVYTSLKFANVTYQFIRIDRNTLLVDSKAIVKWKMEMDIFSKSHNFSQYWRIFSILIVLYSGHMN